VTLRPATPADLPELLTLARSAAVAPFLSINAAGELPGGIDAPGEELLAVEVDGALAGCARLVVRNTRSRISEVRSLMLDPAFRGRGLGTMVLRALTEHAFAAGVHRVEGEVLGFNTAAVAAFEAAGFTREGVRRRAYLRDGSWTDSVLLGRLAEDPSN
jgi:RimJ/RimL family protein N-acetyltransferase